MAISLWRSADALGAAALGFDLPLRIGVLAAVATAAGGVLALTLRARVGLLTAFGAGAVIAAALVDLLPEAIHAAGVTETALMTALMAAGFGAYLLLDRLPQRLGADGQAVGVLGPASLTAHSFFDGIGIATAFQASETAGWAVAMAVVAHDVLDGSNTVVLARRRGAGGVAVLWLIADACAPLAGVLLARRFPVPPSLLAPLLALFAGFFLYIGAGELLPRSRALRPAGGTAMASAAGLAFVWGLSRFVA